MNKNTQKCFFFAFLLTSTYCVKQLDVFRKIKQPTGSNHLQKEQSAIKYREHFQPEAIFLKVSLKSDTTGEKPRGFKLRRKILESSVSNPKSLWTVGVVDEVAPPRKGCGPSRHHELSGRNTSSVNTDEGTVSKNSRKHI